MRIIIEFIGGPMDGKTVVSSDGNGSSVSSPFGDPGATDYYALTNKGTIGARFWTTSEYALDMLRAQPHGAAMEFQPHRYEVTDKLEAEDEVLVRCEVVKE